MIPRALIDRFICLLFNRLRGYYCPHSEVFKHKLKTLQILVTFNRQYLVKLGKISEIY